jgi:hypothetical protein
MNDVFTIITVGNMDYSINCTGIEKFDYYFPFEKEYRACGVQSPYLVRDCWKYNDNNTPCCLASIEPTFNYSYNPLCYYYPKNSNMEIKNYTEINREGRKLYFSCHNVIHKIIYSIISILIIILIF